MTGIERIGVVDIGLVLAREPNLNVDQGHGLVHAPRGKGVGFFLATLVRANLTYSYM